MLVLSSFNKQAELQKKFVHKQARWAIRLDTKQFKYKLIYKFIYVS